jgi:heme exporter protein C
MRKLFVPLLVLATALFACAPFVIANAPFESTMGLIQKIFYFHVPAWWMMFTAVFICGVAGAIFVFRKNPAADRVTVTAAELAVFFGLIGLVTGPLWSRKAWGVWWQWDARLTSALLLELIFVGYLLVRKYGGPGSEKLSAAMALFGMATVPFVYKSVDWWRTIHPQTSVVPSLAEYSRGMLVAIMFSTIAFLFLFTLLFAVRLRLERRRADLDELYLAEEEE